MHLVSRRQMKNTSRAIGRKFKIPWSCEIPFLAIGMVQKAKGLQMAHVVHGANIMLRNLPKLLGFNNVADDKTSSYGEIGVYQQTSSRIFERAAGSMLKEALLNRATLTPR